MEQAPFSSSGFLPADPSGNRQIRADLKSAARYAITDYAYARANTRRALTTTVLLGLGVAKRWRIVSTKRLPGKHAVRTRHAGGGVFAFGKSVVTRHSGHADGVLAHRRRWTFVRDCVAVEGWAGAGGAADRTRGPRCYRRSRADSHSAYQSTLQSCYCRRNTYAAPALVAIPDGLTLSSYLPISRPTEAGY